MSRFAAQPTDDDASESRAREDPTLEWPPEDPGTTMGRLHLVAQVMSSGLWRKGETAGELAEAWGLSQSTIENYSSEASRWLKALTDPDEVKQQLAYYLSKNLRIADGNPRSVAEVSKAYMPLVGIAASGPVVNVLVDQRGQMRPELSGVLVAACETAAAMGLDPRAFRDAMAGRLAPSLPTAAVMALPAPACASPADRARELVAALCEVMPEVEDPSELRPALLAMVADDDGEGG